MPSTAQRVCDYLEEDLALKEILGRGILNVRRAARWLIDQENWESSEEAVVSALRRHRPPATQILADARAALAAAEIGMRSNLYRLAVSSPSRLHPRLREARNRLGEGDKMVVLPGDVETGVIVNGRRREHVADALELEADEAQPIALVQIVFPPEKPGAMMAAAIALNALAQGGIAIREVFSCASEFWIAVDPDDARQTLEAVARLSRLG